MDTRTKVLGLRMAIIAFLLLMPFGSPGDTVALILFALLLTSRKSVQALRDLIRTSPLLTCVLYSGIAIAATWANSRYRLGGGPFHLNVGGDWRGYPFPYQEWGLVPNGTLWREFCWAGASGDALLVALGCIGVTYFLGLKFVQIPRILILSAYSAIFVWLNIEGWLYGAPALFIPSANDIDEGLRQVKTATLGFPLAYWHFEADRRIWALLAANIAIGIAGWVLLYGLMRWARWLGQSPAGALGYRPGRVS
jgi:hypothetical protein